MKKIVVFGSNGKLGMHFVKYLIKNLDLKKYEVVCCGRRDRLSYNFDGDYFKVDVTCADDFSFLPTNDVYAVVDFAGVLPAGMKEDNPQEYIDVNVTGTLNILEYCKKAKVDRILYTQSWADLNGYLKDDVPLKPDLPRKPILTGDHAIYSVTKNAAVDLTDCYHKMYGIKNFIFRLPNIYLYSKNKYYYVDGKQKLVSYRYMIDKAINGEDIEMWGNPDCGKDIIYIKDLCQLLYKGLFADVDGGVYNAGTGVKTTMKQQIEGIIDVFSPRDKPSKIISCPSKKDCDNFVMDISNAKEELGYEPEYDYMAYLEDYKKEMLKDK